MSQLTSNNIDLNTGEILHYKPSHTKGFSTKRPVYPVSPDNLVISKGRVGYIEGQTKHISFDWCVRNKKEIKVLNDLLTDIKKDYRGNYRKYKNALSCLIANLRYCTRDNKNTPLLYSRSKNKHINQSDPKKVKGKILNNTVDWLHDNGYVISVIGNQNSFNGVTSNMKATDKLIKLLRRDKVEIDLVDGVVVIILKGAKNDMGKAEIMPHPTTASGIKEIHKLSIPVKNYHECWKNHIATFNDRELLIYSYRVLNNNSLVLGARLYGAEHLQLTKEERSSIKIDGFSTSHPDFKALHFSMLYAQAGIQLNPVINDPYCIGGFERDVIKKIMLKLINSSDITRFKANITKSGNPKVKAEHEQYKKELLINPKVKKPYILKGFIEEMPDNINGTEVYEAICEKHRPIAHFFGSKDLGLKLQFIDSNIILKAMNELSKQDIPSLGVHDQLIIREHDQKLAEACMLKAYKAETGFTAFISQ